MYGLRGNEAPATGIIVQPTRDRKHGHTAYRFVFGGFGWIFIVSSHAPPAPLAAAFLKSDGHMIISLVDLYASEWMTQFAQERVSREQSQNAF